MFHLDATNKKVYVADFHKSVVLLRAHSSISVGLWYMHNFAVLYENHWGDFTQNLECECLDNGPQCKAAQEKWTPAFKGIIHDFNQMWSLYRRGLFVYIINVLGPQSVSFSKQTSIKLNKTTVLTKWSTYTSLVIEVIVSVSTFCMSYQNCHNLSL